MASFLPYATSFEYGRAMRDSGMTFDELSALHDRSDLPVKDRAAFATGFFGTPPALHFVGFRGDEFTRAVRCFGRPDFVHRHMDARFLHGGELAPHDTVVFANGAESKFVEFTFDDSAVM